MGLMDRFAAKDEDSPTVTTTATTTATTTSSPTNTIKLHKDNAFPWRRFVISLTGISMILFVWRWSINHLYTLPATSIAVYGSITISALYAITFIVAFFITGQTYFTNWQNVSSSSIMSYIQNYMDSKKKSKGKK